jgi:hypothetical protein
MTKRPRNFAINVADVTTDDVKDLRKVTQTTAGHGNLQMMMSRSSGRSKRWREGTETTINVTEVSGVTENLARGHGGHQGFTEVDAEMQLQSMTERDNLLRSKYPDEQVRHRKETLTRAPGSMDLSIVCSKVMIQHLPKLPSSNSLSKKYSDPSLSRDPGSA